jgi:hypothetical protein
LAWCIDFSIDVDAGLMFLLSCILLIGYCPGFVYCLLSASTQYHLSHIDILYCSSPRWQGFNDSGLHSVSQQAWGKRKIAAKQASTHRLQESDGLNVCAGPLETGTKLSQVEQGKVHHQPCNVRSPIGIVTSSVPRGRYVSQ